MFSFKAIIKVSILFFLITSTVAYSAPARNKRKEIKPLAPIVKSGVITEDQTWSGNILITGDVLILEKITVKISPGTTIVLSENKSDFDTAINIGGHAKNNKCNIIVRGTLKAVGAKGNMITFGKSEKRADGSYRWGGIVFDSPISSVLTNCKVENAIFGITLLNANNSNIEACIVENCSIGIYVAENAKGKVIGTTIKNCKTGIESTGESSPTITSNNVAENEWGVSYGGNSMPNINNNAITKNKVGVSCYGRKEAIFESNKIKNNAVGVECFSASKPTFKNNEITGNKVGIEYSASSSPNMIKNSLSNNKEDTKKK